MRLISCYMENFGKFSAKEWKFDDKLSQFLSDNGSGKTTLADFVRVMFYGMPNEKKSDKVDYALRERYAPFNGGQFGGNLIFSEGGNEYRIERFFGERTSGKDDKVKLLKNGFVEEVDENIGQHFFGVDEESFLRTLFIGDLTYDKHGSADIKNKLNDLTEADEETIDFNEAISDLKEIAKRYGGTRSKNNEASILQAEKSTANYRIAEINSMICGLDDLNRSHNEKSMRLSELKRMKNLAYGEGVLAQKWERYHATVKEIENAKNALDALRTRYPNGMPTAENITATENAINDYLKARNAYESNVLRDRDRAEYEGQKNVFSVGVPDDAQLKEIRDKIAGYEKISGTFDSAPSVVIPYAGNFGRPYSAENVKAELSAATGDLRQAREAVEECKGRLRTSDETPKKKSPLFIALFAVFAILVAAGIGVIFRSVPVGVALAVAGIVGLFVTGFLYLSKQNSANTSHKEDELRAELRSKENKVEECTLRIYAVLSAFGFSREASPEEDVRTFFAREQQYQSALAAARQKDEERALAQRGSAALGNELKQWFAVFKIDCGYDFRKALEILTIERNEYIRLTALVKEFESKHAELGKDLEQKGALVAAALSTFGLSSVEQWGAVREVFHSDIAKFAYLTKEIEEKKVKALNEKPERELTSGTQDIEMLEAETESLQRQIADIDREIEKLDKLADTRNELCEKIRDIDEKLEGYKKIYELYNDTAKYLTMAKQRVDERFVDPIRKRFLSYMKTFLPSLDRKFDLNRDFDILVDESGGTHSEIHLSAGESAVVSLCIRLALIDSIFDGISPFIVLDDSFCRIDKKRFDLLKPLLNDLTDRFQIAYFTCAGSRSLV